MSEKEIFSTYNEKWANREFKTPICVLIGGNIGTGKSTFARLLTDNIDHINVLPTGIIRSVLQSLDIEADYPFLYGHSYTLGNLIQDPNLTDTERAVKAYILQLGIIDKSIRRIIQFSQTEGQQYIIDGNHVSPQTIYHYKDWKNIIGVIFQTSDTEQYERNVSGPTHQRNLTDDEFNIVRAIHDHLVQDAESLQIPIFEYNQQDNALQYVQSRIQTLMKGDNE